MAQVSSRGGPVAIRACCVSAGRALSFVGRNLDPNFTILRSIHPTRKIALVGTGALHHRPTIRLKIGGTQPATYSTRTLSFSTLAIEFWS